jgi:predicted PurR-regulated permease PerM
MKYNEAAVFKWVLIFGAAVASGVIVALLLGGLVGALWGLLLAILGLAYAYRWTREWWRNSRGRPGGPDHSV